MRFGVALPNQFPARSDFAAEISAVLAHVRLARDLGFDAILAGEHRLAAPYTYCSPMPFLARLSAEAGDMSLVAVSLLALHNPVDVAEDGATLDAICDGRFVLAAALGYRDIEYLAFGVDRRTRVARFVEALGVLDALWGGDEAQFDGVHFRLPRTAVATRPVRPGGPPVWVAASGDGAVARAGTLGRPWLAAPAASVVTLAAQRALYERACGAAGHAVPGEMPVIREVVVAADRTDARELARRFLGEKYRTYHEWGHDTSIAASQSFDVPFDELAADRFLVGTPDDVVAGVERLVERVGATSLFVHCHWPGMSHDASLEILRLFGEEVVPAVQARPARKGAPR